MLVWRRQMNCDSEADLSLKKIENQFVNFKKSGV